MPRGVLRHAVICHHCCPRHCPLIWVTRLISGAVEHFFVFHLQITWNIFYLFNQNSTINWGNVGNRGAVPYPWQLPQSPGNTSNHDLQFTTKDKPAAKCMVWPDNLHILGHQLVYKLSPTKGEEEAKPCADMVGLLICKGHLTKHPQICKSHFSAHSSTENTACQHKPANTGTCKRQNLMKRRSGPLLGHQGTPYRGNDAATNNHIESRM